MRFTAFVVAGLLPAALSFAPSSQRALLGNNVKVSRSFYTPQIITENNNNIQSNIIAPQTSTWEPHYMTATTADGVADDAEEGIPAGDATVTQLIFNLVKGSVGAGVLSLPAGIAAWANAPSAVVPAVALIAAIGGLSGYGFALIGRVCSYTNTKSYRDAWSATVGEKSSWIPAVAVTFKTICAILAYSMILGDTTVSLAATAGYQIAKVPATIILTSAVLLPLCLLKNLSSLAPFSLVGSLGMIYTAVAMVIRYVTKAYAVGGKFANDVAPAFRPAFGSVGAEGVLAPSAAILVGMLSTAYMVRLPISV